jgi:hypothetical protein
MLTLDSSLQTVLTAIAKVNQYVNGNKYCQGHKGILVTSCGGPLSCETLRLPHLLDNQFIDREDASLMS